MTWYLVRTGLNAKDMFGEVGYVELDAGVEEETVRQHLEEEHPSFHRGQYVKSFSEMDWEVDSESFDDEEAFLAALGEVVGSSSNNAYSREFGRVSTKEARKKS